MPLTDTQIEAARSQLYSAVLSDVLDSLGDTEHAMRPSVRPLDDSVAIFGPVRTGLYMEMYAVEPDVNPYELEIALVDDLKPGEIIVLACPDSHRIAPWGELLSTAARARGAAGCVTDGLVRDIRSIREMEFPVFAGGVGPLDAKGRAMIMRIDIPVECGGVLMAPGDWLFGDADGAVVVREPLLEEAVRKSLEKVEGENATREALESGESLRSVFERFGIL